MSKHLPEWSPAPHPVDPDIATAADTVEARLTVVGYDGFGAELYAHQLSDSPNRVLRASDVHGWDAVVGRLSAAELVALAKAVI